jgi:adenosylhomocysteine nucleosidase
VILIACGLQREARVMAQNGIVIVGGGDPVRLEAELEAAAGGAVAILSSGIAGAVDPQLEVGDVVIDGEFFDVLLRMLPGARAGRIVGSDVMITTVANKRAIFEESGALAVDMESHIAARVALRHGLPFAALRVISDTADEALPPAALIGMRPDGKMALGGVLASLARHPAQLPALIRTGLSAGKAFRSLERCHYVLRRGGIGELDFREFALDV